MTNSDVVVTALLRDIGVSTTQTDSSTRADAFVAAATALRAKIIADLKTMRTKAAAGSFAEGAGDLDTASDNLVGLLSVFREVSRAAVVS